MAKTNKKRNVKVEAVGQAHIHSSFNNIIISLTNNAGQVISWSSAGKQGFKGSKKNTPYAAQTAAEDCAKVAHEAGLRKVKVYGAGSIGNHLAQASRRMGWSVDICDIDNDALDRTKNEIYIEALKSILPPIILIILVLGSILFGVATPTESASVGAVGAAIIALTKGELTFQNIKETALGTVKLSSFVFIILIGASMFSLVFRGFGGDEMIEHFLGSLPGGMYTGLLIVMVAIFLLGFFLDYIEIIFVIVPLVGPILIANGADPLWLGILISLNLQTSFLTPPFGFSLFFLYFIMSFY